MGKIRKLSNTFIDNLLEGHLKDVLEVVKADMDLDLQIRANYINIYYKGNSLLKLSEVDSGRYTAESHEKFTSGVPIPDLTDEASTANFLERIPSLKENITEHGKSSLELEYEQLIIRANNNEPRNNTEYFIVDRQYVDPKGRFDLVGFYWNLPRHRGDVVPLCLMEVKFALNPDIGELHSQLNTYYDAMKSDFKKMASEFQGILQQKLELRLFDQKDDRLDVMKTLTINDDINNAQFIVILIDYNPRSKFFERARLHELPFADQVKIFRTGFGLWQTNLDIPVRV